MLKELCTLFIMNIRLHAQMFCCNYVGKYGFKWTFWKMSRHDVISWEEKWVGTLHRKMQHAISHSLLSNRIFWCHWIQKHKIVIQNIKVLLKFFVQHRFKYLWKICILKTSKSSKNPFLLTHTSVISIHAVSSLERHFA